MKALCLIFFPTAQTPTSQLSAMHTMLQDKVPVPSEAELGAVQKEEKQG